MTLYKNNKITFTNDCPSVGLQIKKHNKKTDR